ncbi:MAG: transcription termination/antitermination protein NusG [Candidatus Omnitrophica bacterium]|nr:transcription termination/antitermination protein NusG [Candidatus Omnitrophota bacterium]MCM8826985.1 transcription termination/antitermination protein NusG [Candidatus Omnitrophota bacterium]
MKKWYIVHTLSGAEEKAKENLKARIEAFNMHNFIDEIVIPKEQVTEVRMGKKRVLERKYFPGYLLIHMDLDDAVWLFVKKTPGIANFIGPGGKPTPLSDEEVNKILARAEETKVKPLPKLSFEKGENVRVIEGPFVNFNGVVDEVNIPKGKLKVNITIFGRTTPVELELWQVEKI